MREMALIIMDKIAKMVGQEWESPFKKIEDIIKDIKKNEKSNNKEFASNYFRRDKSRVIA